MAANRPSRVAVLRTMQRLRCKRKNCALPGYCSRGTGSCGVALRSWGLFDQSLSTLNESCPRKRRALGP
eukprot:5416036-Pyramimonas_sp.AAC.1